VHQPHPQTQPPGANAEAHKTAVRRLVEEVMNDGRLDLIDELCTPELAAGARRWIAPFRESFPDVQMEVVQLTAEGDTVAAHFRCSGTHLGPWRGHEPTGRRFRVDEVYFFEFADQRIAGAWGIEDTHRRLKQLGLPA
jgi:predicted ester cyclase